MTTKSRSIRPSYSKPRVENIRIMIADLKIRKNLRDQDIADALNMPISTFRARKGNPGQFRMWEMWTILQLAEAGEDKKAELL